MAYELLLSIVACFVFSSTSSSAFDFHVGGARGWSKPARNETETYNNWAARNRFHVGDSLYFKYENDSVLVVDLGDYETCRTSEPVHKFTDGRTEFTLDRAGYFCFISGEPGHCKAGQRLVVRVMVHPGVLSPGSGPAPQTGDGSVSDFGPAPAGQYNSNASPKLVNDGSFVGMVMVWWFIFEFVWFGWGL